MAGHELSYIFTVRWQHIQIGRAHYIRERIDGIKGYVEYGPIDPQDTDAFVEERKSFYATLYRSNLSHALGPPVHADLERRPI